VGGGENKRGGAPVQLRLKGGEAHGLAVGDVGAAVRQPGNFDCERTLFLSNRAVVVLDGGNTSSSVTRAGIALEGHEAHVEAFGTDVVGGQLLPDTARCAPRAAHALVQRALGVPQLLRLAEASGDCSRRRPVDELDAALEAIQ
jgi:hypothetical protein